MPWHVARGVRFVQERFGAHGFLDIERICSYIEYTRFPVPQDPEYHETDSFRALARAADLIGQLAAAVFTGVDHTDNLTTSSVNSQRSSVGIVIVGGDNDLLAGQHTPVDDVVAHSGRQHNAGHIVACKRQRTFDGTGCGDYLRCADAP